MTDTGRGRGLPPTCLFELVGELTTLTPLSITDPRPGRESRRTVTPCPTMPVGFGGTIVNTAYLPGSTLRGKLRRAVVEILLGALAAADGSWPIDANVLNWLITGGAKSKGKPEQQMVGLPAAIVERNPVIALFGSGQPFVTGLLEVSHGLPSEPVAPIEIAFARTSPSRDAGMLRALSSGEIDDFLQELRAARDQGEVNQPLLLAYQAIPPGISLGMRIGLPGASDALAGLVVRALLLLAASSQIGGQRRIGNGRIGGRFTAHRLVPSLDRRGIFESQILGDISWQSAGTINYTGEIGDLLEAWERHAAGLTRDDILPPDQWTTPSPRRRAGPKARADANP